MKKNAGITMVSLVVTIIVLLILSSITIGALFGDNGILTIAKRAKENTELARIEEETSLNDLYKQLGVEDGSTSGGNTGGGNSSINSTGQGKILPTPSEWKRYEVDYVETEEGNIVQSSKQVASVYAVSVGNGDIVPVPYGFYYVGGTLNSGVVISDNEADKNKYLFADNVKIEDVPAGVAYNSDGTVNTSSSDLKGNQFVWIPCTLEEYKKVYIVGNGYADAVTTTAEEAQIIKYGGFYIGRYEAGTSDITFTNDSDFAATSTAVNLRNSNFTASYVKNGKITCKAGEIPYYYADYATAVKMCRDMYSENSSITSGLVTGTMWDAVMKFITTDSTSYSDLKSTPWGNYNSNTGLEYTQGRGRYLAVNSTSGGAIISSAIVSDGSYHYGIRTTAFSESTKRKNMYDLAGNLWEWTQEVMSVNQNILRGGGFDGNSSNRPVSYRVFDYDTITKMMYGFRPALYIR